MTQAQAHGIVDVLHRLSTVDPSDSRRGAIESAAARIGVSPASAYNWIAKGGIPKSRHLLAVLEALHGSTATTRVSLAEIRTLIGTCATEPDTESDKG